MQPVTPSLMPSSSREPVESRARVQVRSGLDQESAEGYEVAFEEAAEMMRALCMEGPNAEICARFSLEAATVQQVRDLTLSVLAEESTTVAVARECIENMQGVGAPPDSETLNAYLKLCISARDGEAAAQAIGSMIQRGLRLDALAWCTLVSTCAHFGDAAGAQAIVQMMRDCGVRPGRSVLNALMAAYLNAGDLDGAGNVAAAMPLDGVVPDVAYDELLRVSVDRLDLGRAIESHNAMLAAGLLPGPYIYVMLLKICHKYRDVAQAQAVWNMMSAGGIRPSEGAYAYMAAIHEADGNPAQADAVMEQGIADGTFTRYLGFGMDASTGRRSVNLHARCIVTAERGSKAGISAILAEVVISFHLRRGNVKVGTPLITGDGSGRIRSLARDLVARAGYFCARWRGDRGCLVVIRRG